MGAFSELLAADAGPEPSLCKVGQYVAALDDDDRESLERLLADPDWELARIWRLARGAKFTGAQSTWNLHFRSGCICFDG